MLLTPSAAAAQALVYPKVGRVLRVPFRPGAGQPTRQFARWFGRMAAARPGFPQQVKSILLLADEPLDTGSLRRYLGRYHLADRLRVRQQAPRSGPCRPQRHRPAPPPRTANLGVQLDALLLAGELEQESWWQRAKRTGAASLASLALLLGPQAVPKPVYDLAKAGGQVVQQRRRMHQVGQRAVPPATGSGQQEIGGGYPLPGQPGTPVRQAPPAAPASAGPSVINPYIDVFAQYAIQRMLKSPDPAARADGAQLLAAPEAQLLWGIYQEDELVPAQWARRHGTNWWQLLEPGEDATVLLSESPFGPDQLLPPIIVFRDSIRSNAARLDPALRRAWALVRVALLLKAAAPLLTLEKLRAAVRGIPIGLGDAPTAARVQQAVRQQFAADLAPASLAAGGQRPRQCSCGANLQCLRLRWFCLCLSGSLKPPSFQLKLCSYA